MGVFNIGIIPCIEFRDSQKLYSYDSRKKRFGKETRMEYLQGVSSSTRTILKLLLLLGAVYFFLRYLSPLIAPFLLAILFVSIFGPVFLKLQKRLHFSRQLSAALFLLLFLSVVIGLFWLLSSWIINSLPDWIAWIADLGQKLEVSVIRLCDRLETIFHLEGDVVRSILLGGLNQSVAYLQQNALSDLMLGLVPVLKQVGNAGIFLVVFAISTVFMAKDYDKVMTKLLEKEEFHLILEVLCGVVRYLAIFVRAQLLLILLISATCVLGLSLFQVEKGFFYGLLAGVLDALPFVGTGIVLVPLAIYQCIMHHYLKALGCLVLYAVCILIRELLEPRLIGKKMGLPPLFVLAALFVGVRLFGVMGIIKGPLGFLLVKLIYQSKYGTL